MRALYTSAIPPRPRSCWISKRPKRGGGRPGSLTRSPQSGEASSWLGDEYGDLTQQLNEAEQKLYGL